MDRLPWIIVRNEVPVMIGLVLIAAAVLQSPAYDASLVILATLDAPDLTKEGIDAVIIRVPPPAAISAFAAGIVAAEHLKSWNGAIMADNAKPGPLGFKAMAAGDGRSIAVYYSREPGAPRMVCRLRTTHNTGLSDARYRAFQWCATQVGVEVPAKPAPPVEMRAPRFEDR